MRGEIARDSLQHRLQSNGYGINLVDAMVEGLVVDQVRSVAVGVPA